VILLVDESMWCPTYGLLLSFVAFSVFFGFVWIDGTERSGMECNGAKWNRDFIPLFGYVMK